MKHIKLYLFLFVYLFTISTVNAQMLSALNGSFNITGIDLIADKSWQIKGDFLDTSGSGFSASNIQIGDRLIDSNGNSYNIVTIGQSSDSKTQLLCTSLENGSSISRGIGIGILFHPTKKGISLAVVDAPAVLAVKALNSSLLTIDAKTPVFSSGTVLPVFSYAIGDVILNSSDNNYYLLSGSGWAQISSSDIPVSYDSNISTVLPGNKGDMINMYFASQFYYFNGSAWVIPASISSLPDKPNYGDVFYATGEQKLYMYGADSKWISISGASTPGGSTVDRPITGKPGNLFYDSDNNTLYVFTTLGTWVEVSQNGSIPSGIFNPDPATITIKEGTLFYNTSDHKLYVYNGTIWMPTDNTLPNGQIYVGNSTNVATPVTMSGDATINNSGKLTVATKAITDDKLDKTHIPLSGFANPTDNVSFGDGTTNNRVVNLANPTGSQDAATKNYVDALFTNPAALLTLPLGYFFVGSISNKAVATTKVTIPISGFGSATSNISLGDGTTNNKIVNMANPLVAQDAATKSYVDTKIIDPISITLATGSLLLGNASGKAGPVAKNTILLSGFGAAAADVAVGGFKLTNVADPVAAQDVATKNYVDTKAIDAASLNLATSNVFVGNSSGKAVAILKSAIPLSDFAPALADLSVGNFKITNLAAPLGNNDAVTKKYIDDLFATPSTGLALPTGKVFLGNATGKAIATSTGTIPVSGFGKATSTINMGDAAIQYNISFLAEPLFAQDAATKNYVDTKLAGPGAMTLTLGSVYVGNASNQASDVPKSSIPISDFGAAKADISLGNGTTNYRITNLSDPTTDQEAATKKYVDTKTASTQSGGTLPSGGQVSDTYYSTTDNRLYVYNGTTWIPVDNSLANGQLYVGNASGIATATAKNTIPLSGFAAAGADIPLGNGTTNYKITLLADPTADQDAATKKYVDSKIAAPGPLTLLSGSVFVGNSSNVAGQIAKNAVPISDFGAATAGILLGDGTTNFKISNLADPTADQEAATKKYVDSKSVSTQSGTTPPTSGQTGDTYYNTADNRLYTYNGVSWLPVSNVLANGLFFVGNTSGVATATAKNTIPISGFGAASANIALGNGTTNFKITNLLDPTADQEAATKKYVDAKTASSQNGGTLPATGQSGDTFYSTTDNKLYTYNGTTWVAVGNDNLGNHTATANLKMQTFSMSNSGGTGDGLSFDATENATMGKDFTVNGNFYTPSDRRLKTNIETLSLVLKSIDQIRGVRFEYKDKKKYATGPKIGIIAQELQKVFPEMVNKGRDGFLKVDYTQLTGVLIQAVKEQQNQINLQEIEIKSLKDRMNSQQLQIDAILRKLP